MYLLFPARDTRVLALATLANLPIRPVLPILPDVFFFIICAHSQCPENYTCMPNTGDNPISEYISYDNFGWALLTSLQLVTMDYWESIYNSVSKRFVR